MNIYVSHLRRGNYEEELYKPLLASQLAQKHTLIFPHRSSQKPFNTREMLEQKKCDIVLAEISYPATGQGIELGWASQLEIPIYCMYKKGMDVSGSALMIAAKKIEYVDTNTLICQLEELFI
jgi:nucleoside 2-deoxyribosyltransferase